MSDRIVEWAKELQSLAQAGLWYGQGDFDKERYRRIREISAEMMAEQTDLPLDRVKDLFCDGIGYQTPKVGTRAAIFKDGKILLVCERNGKWTLPGGWCDYNLSPAENTVKEVKEEAGLDVEIDRVIAVQDRDKHNKPQYAYKVVTIVYLCRALSGSFAQNLETTDSRYFSEDCLPLLDEDKTNAEQIGMCFAAYKAANWAVQFD